MSEMTHKTGAYTSAFILFAGVSTIGTALTRDQSMLLGLAYFAAFFGYFWSCKFPASGQIYLWLGIGLRLILFLQLPTLSDDIYRFLWDGYLLHADLDPYQAVPQQLIAMGELPAGLSENLYHLLNSPAYYSIYPPINQAVFWLATWSSDWLVATNIIRLLLLGADIYSYFLLRKLLVRNQLSAHLANWFWLNPLIILELVGNIHFEGFVIALLLTSIYYYQQHKRTLTGMALGMAAGTKLLPLIFLPAVLFRSKRKNGIYITAVAGVVFVIVMAPMLSSALLNSMTNSLDLYVRKFEFNASFYFIFRQIGFWLRGYNTIQVLGPSLAALSAISIFGWTWWARKKKLATLLLGSLSIYLLLTTTVHPWYVLPLIPLGILSGFYFPIVWSAMVFVTYFGYSQEGFELSASWVVVEYTIVFCYGAFELFTKSQKQHA